MRFLNEQVILYKIRKGDTESFAQIFDFYSEKIYRFIYLKVATAQDAEDLTSETFLKVWQYVKEGKKVGTLQAFMYQVARNLVIDFYRKKGAPVESIEDGEITIADRSDLSLEEKMTLKADMARTEEGLRKLKDAYREVIVLHYLKELSLVEVARVIEKSQGATRVLLHRGMKALKTVIGNQ